MSYLQKVIGYITNTNSFDYIRKNPTKLIKNIKSLIFPIDYLGFVSNVLNIQKNEIGLLRPGPESQKMLAKAFTDSIAPSTNQSPCSLEEALSLYLITRSLKPNIVVETGVSAGRSSSYLLCSLHDNNQGDLYSIDPYSKAGNAIPEKLKYRWHFANATSQESLREILRKTGCIDIFLHDSLHTYDNMLWEYKTAWPLIKCCGLLISHDVGWNSAFKDFSKQIKGKIYYLNSGFVVVRKLGM